MKKAKGRSNAQTLFQIGAIPSDNQIRDILDEAKPEHVYPIFTDIFNTLIEHEYLEISKALTVIYCERMMEQNIIIPRPFYFPNCNVTNHRNGTVTYSHKAIRTKVVAPKNDRVISLEPEFITKQDGAKKQDCEHEAMKRWLLKHSAHYQHLGITWLKR